MKAFLTALVFIAVVTVGADVALEKAGFSAAETFQTDHVRLGE